MDSACEHLVSNASPALLEASSLLLAAVRRGREAETDNIDFSKGDNSAGTVGLYTNYVIGCRLEENALY